MPRSLREQFPRTSCRCPDCSVYCKTMPGMLAPEDFAAISDYFGILADELEEKLLAASPGAIVGQMSLVNGQSRLNTFRIPTIVPRKTETGCVFYILGRCVIHPVAPFGCACFDSHMSAAEGNRRSAACLKAIMENAAYEAAWGRLCASGHLTIPPERARELSR